MQLAYSMIDVHVGGEIVTKLRLPSSPDLHGKIRVEVESLSITNMLNKCVIIEEWIDDEYVYFAPSSAIDGKRSYKLRAKVMPISDSSASAVHSPTSHISAMKPGVGGDVKMRYHLFSAAHDGCLQCVRRLIEDDGIPADAQSVSGNFNVLEWAKHGGHQPVIDYVQNLAK